MKKWTFATLWAALIAALTTVPAFADLIIPGQPRQPSPAPAPAPDPTPLPVPDPVPSQPDTALITVLIVGTVIIAAAVIAWVIARRRRRVAG